MKKYQNLNGNTISDLAYLMDILKDTIENRFCHVSEHLPPSLIKMIDTVKNGIEKELERREEIYYS